MASVNISIKPKTKSGKKILVEIDAAKFERLAAEFGFFNPEFVKSLKKSEKDHKAGRTKKIRSLKTLRKK